MVKSGKMETDQTLVVWPEKVFTTPPVCISQSLAVQSLLPDTSNLPSDEKVRQFTSSVCPERTAAWLPVIALRLIISPFLDPTTMVPFQYERLHMQLSNETVWEHVPHPAGSPLTTLTSGDALPHTTGKAKMRKGRMVDVGRGVVDCVKVFQ